jgi:type II secretory pathway pseudopilin PulG
MAALLVMIAIMMTLMTVAMPAWRHLARREKEAELVFRGEQYARAIALYRTKNANLPNAFPPSIDVLVQGKYLRKKYKDPMTKDGEFMVIPVGGQQPGISGGGPGGVLDANPQAGRGNPTPTQPRPGPQPQAGGPAAGGVMGVRSKSTENSIRSYRGATRYDLWQFTFNVAPRPGGAMPTAPGEGARNPDTAAPGGFPPRGGPGSGRGPRGGQPGRGGFGGAGVPPPAPVLPPGGRGRGLGPGGRGGGDGF